MKPRKVLVVDDSALMHRIYDVMLRDQSVVHAHDGREALERMAQHTDVDLMLLDINMPEMNGFEVLDRLREGGQLANLQVVVVTTEGGEEEARRGLRAGAAAYLTKPFRNEQIRDAIAQLPERATTP
ncbi:MAG: response regulator [Acidobacteriota bacterium]